MRRRALRRGSSRDHRPVNAVVMTPASQWSRKPCPTRADPLIASAGMGSDRPWSSDGDGRTTLPVRCVTRRDRENAGVRAGQGHGHRLYRRRPVAGAQPHRRILRESWRCERGKPEDD
jgi:hypothetical protein